MAIASHIIWSTYGFWLPNESRGSWSTRVWARHLQRFGMATKVETTRSVAHQNYDRGRRREMQGVLKYPPVRLTGVQARAVGRGFGQVIEQTGLNVYACAIMPDHVHMVVARHRLDGEEISQRLKSAGTRRMSAEGVRPLAGCVDRHGRVPTPWAMGGWIVYLDTSERVGQCVKYVEGNPVRQGLRRQRWGFVAGLEG